MAIRMALLAHHYRSDWEWTDAVLGDAQARLARWRAALARAEAAVRSRSRSRAAADAEAVTPGTAPAAPPRWCWPACAPGCATTSTPPARSPSWTAGPTPCSPNLRPASPPRDLAGARLVQATVDALLGISL